MTGRVLLGVLLAGWLADRLARADRDVEAGIEAYEAGELDVALERFEAAISRHGDRPELSYDRGLVLLAKDDGGAARRAFERASEPQDPEDPEVRASAFYEGGNVAFDAEEWDSAIEAYIECLKIRPDHTNAKWNLELARLRKQQDDEDEEEEDEDEDEEDDPTGGEESGSSDSGGSGGEDTGGSTGGSDSGGTGGEDSGGTTGGSDDGQASGGSDDGQGTTGGEDSGGSGQPPDEGGTGEPPPDEGGTGQPPSEAPPPPLDQVDIQKALEDLDAQDQFLLDRPVGGVRPPTEDW